MKDGNLFDVTMGSYDGAEICELVGLFLLHELNTLMTDKAGSIGLYRDDGLAAVYNLSGPAIDRLKKDITKIFQTHGLSIITETNLIQTDFLDVTFNLETEKFWPYRKPGNQPLYINIRSNHPPTSKNSYPKWWNRGFRGTPATKTLSKTQPLATRRH